MSRTYKDRPARVQANDPRNRKHAYEHHWCGPMWEAVEFKEQYRIRLWDKKEYLHKVPTLWTTTYKECTLHDVDAPDRPYSYVDCHYLPQHKTDWTWQYSKFDQDARDFYNGIQRAERRTKTKQMVDEYNACGIIEDDYVFEPFKKKDGWD